MDKENIKKENIELVKVKKYEKRRKKIIPLLVVLNFLLLGHLVTFSMINKNKIDSLIDLNNKKNQRTCESYSKNIMKNIIINEKKTGKTISTDKEKDLLRLKIKCLYDNGYDVKVDDDKNSEIEKKENKKNK